MLITRIKNIVNEIGALMSARPVWGSDKSKNVFEHWGQVAEDVKEPPQQIALDEKGNPLQKDAPPVQEQKAEAGKETKETAVKAETKDAPADKGKDAETEQTPDNRDAEAEQVIYRLSETIELPAKKLAEIAARTREEFGGEDFDSLTPEQRFKLIEKNANLYLGGVKVNERHQENASTKKELDKRSKELEVQRKEIENAKRDLEEQLRQGEARRAELKELVEQDPEDILNFTERAELIYNQKDAQKELAQIDAKEAELKSLIEAEQAKVTATMIRGLIDEIQINFPELQTDADAVDVYDRFLMKQADTIENKDDLTKSLRLSRVISDYLKSNRTDMSITEFYRFEKDVNYPELKLSSAQTKGKKSEKVVDVKQAKAAQVLKDLLERAQSDPPNPAGKTSTGTSSTVKIGGDNNLSPYEFAKKHGYNPAPGELP